MPDTQIHPTGVVQAPGDFVIPASAEIVLKTVYASFDGTGASGDFKPCLRIISDAGSVVGEMTADDVVAAGASADVTWFPRLARKGKTAAATALSWASIYKNTGTQADTGYGLVGLDFPTSSFATTDASLFATGVRGGFHGIQIKVAGSYLIYADLNFTVGSAPAAGAYCGMSIDVITTSFANEFDEQLFVQDGAASWSAFATQLQVTELGSISFPVPAVVTLDVGQNSSHTCDIVADLFVVQLGTATP